MATLYIDNEAYEAREQQNLLEACLSNGIDLPYFCWHPELGSVGACRQCAVKQYKDENDTQGKLVMSCMTPVSEGAQISVNDQEADQFRKSIIEELMTNHPHDCPTCDEGGHCHLQDMTIMTGHNYRRFRFNKKTFRNQDLGPFIHHEMNRCITCYRCVRFYRDFAGGRDLKEQANGARTYFGRHEDGPLQNEFSGNLVEVCPTGVFTDKTYRKHYTRKWDLTTAPSICHHCGVGCNIIAGERYGTLRRVETRYNGEVNGYFLCDRGRFGYEFVNNDERIKYALKRESASGNQSELPKERALSEIGDMLGAAEATIGIGSPRASLEANQMLKDLVGAENFYLGMSDKDYKLTKKAYEILQKGPARTPGLREIQEADAAFVLGEDVTNTAPMVALYLRQVVKTQPREYAMQQAGIPEWQELALQHATYNQYGPLYIAAHHKTKLDDIAKATIQTNNEAIARLGHAVANKINPSAPTAEGLTVEEQAKAEQIADSLKNAKRPLIVSGTSSGSEAVMEAAANIAYALCTDEKRAELTMTVPEANSMGLAILDGKPLHQGLSAVKDGKADTAIILENDLYRRASHNTINQFVSNVSNLIVLEHHETDITPNADIVLPAGSFAESDGTVVNNEGRAQRFYQVYVTENDIHESWRWIREIFHARGHGNKVEDLQSLDDFTQRVIAENPVFQAMENIAPPPGFRVHGQKIPRQSHRYSGRTAMNAHKSVSEPKPPEDPDSPLSFTMEGFRGQVPSSNISYFWAPGWSSIQSVNKFQIEVGGKLHGGDPGKRLIEPASMDSWSFYDTVPSAFQGQDAAFFVVPFHHIFGSDEMSMNAPAVRERSVDPYIALNTSTAEKLGIQDGDPVDIGFEESELRLPLKVMSDIPVNLAGFPRGLPGLPELDLPEWAYIQKSDKAVLTESAVSATNDQTEVDQ